MQSEVVSGASNAEQIDGRADVFTRRDTPQIVDPTALSQNSQGIPVSRMYHCFSQPEDRWIGVRAN